MNRRAVAALGLVVATFMARDSTGERPGTSGVASAPSSLRIRWRNTDVRGFDAASPSGKLVGWLRNEAPRNTCGVAPDGRISWRLSPEPFLIRSAAGAPGGGLVFKRVSGELSGVSERGVTEWTLVPQGVVSDRIAQSDGGWLVEEGTSTLLLLSRDGDVIRRYESNGSSLGRFIVDAAGRTLISVAPSNLEAVSSDGHRDWNADLGSHLSVIVPSGDGEIVCGLDSGELIGISRFGEILWRVIGGTAGSVFNLVRTPNAGLAFTSDGVHLLDSARNKVWSYRGMCPPDYCGFSNPIATPEGLLVTENPNPDPDFVKTYLMLLRWSDGTPIWRELLAQGGVSDPLLMPDGTLYLEAGSETLAIDTCTSGPADTDWPMEFHDVLRTNNVNTRGVPRDWRVAILRAAHAPGAFGSDWRTDLDLVNPSADPSVVSLYWWPADSPGLCAAGVVYRTIPARGSLKIPDVVSSVFGASGAGVVELRSFSGDPRARARTFNLATAGTFGTEVPALAPAAALKPGDVGVLGGLVRSSGFRTNVGFWNAAGDEPTAEVVLFGSDGTELGRASASLGVRENRQWNDVFSAAGVSGDVESAWAEVRVTSPTGLVHVYASVTDNATGDPVFVPVDRGPGPVESRAAGCPAVDR